MSASEMTTQAKREYVEKAWEHTGFLKSGECFIEWIHESRATRYRFGSWDAAYAFTIERERKIAEIEEEIAWLTDGMAVSGDYEPIGERILAREQAALQEMRSGMRKEGE